MKVGDVSIAESAYGIHVVKLLAHIPAVRQSFEMVKTDLLHDAETEYVLAAWNNYLRNIRADPKLFVDVEALDALRPKLPDLSAVPPVVPAAGTSVIDPPTAAKK
jgi:hypothetical protein